MILNQGSTEILRLRLMLEQPDYLIPQDKEAIRAVLSHLDSTFSDLTEETDAKPARPGLKIPTAIERHEEAAEQCRNILEAILDLPESAEDFSASVEETVSSILEWIEEKRAVTPKQLAALDNIEKGVAKWIS